MHVKAFRILANYWHFTNNFKLSFVTILYFIYNIYKSFADNCLVLKIQLKSSATYERLIWGTQQKKENYYFWPFKLYDGKLYVLLLLSVLPEDEVDCNLVACACLSCSFNSLIAWISFFSFILLFWNHILIWRSVRHRECAISMRLLLVK